MAYTIRINEAQRIGLLELMEAHGEPRELEYWYNMLKELPKEERESPDCIHGFCL